MDKVGILQLQLDHKPTQAAPPHLLHQVLKVMALHHHPLPHLVTPSVLQDL